MSHRVWSAALLLLAIGLQPATAHAADGNATERRFVKWSAAPVALGTGMGSAVGSRHVRYVQRRLRSLGFIPGPVDGVFGPRTDSAVRAFQRTRALQIDGVVGPRTLAALLDVPKADWRAGSVRRGAGYKQVGGSERVREVQYLLRAAGARPGPVDGLFGPRTHAAVRRFQRGARLRVDGIVGVRTVRTLRASTEPSLPRTRATLPPTVTPAADPMRSPAGAALPAPDPNTSPALLWTLAALASMALAAAAGFALGYRRDSRGAQRRVLAAAPAAAVPERPPVEALAAPTATDRPAGRGFLASPALETIDLPGTAPPAGFSRGSRIGELLTAAGATSPAAVRAALERQRSAGGRLGEILLAYGAVERLQLRDAVARQLGVGVADADDAPIPLLPRASVHRLRAVALDGDRTATVRVAVEDPSDAVLQGLAAELGVPFEPKLADRLDLDQLATRAYGTTDVAELAGALRTQQPVFSASGPTSRLRTGFAIGFVFLTAVALFLDTATALNLIATVAVLLYVVTTGLRLFLAWKGSHEAAAFDASAAELAALSERDLPVYTLLLPLYGEKESTLRVLFDAIGRLEYPKHKLDCLLLLEEHDKATRDAVEGVGCPAWFRRIVVPPGGPQTKPMAMQYGLSLARGELVAIYDAEDEPDPLQLKRAICAFRRGGPRLACVQAKLGYYNPRQNLLTRLFTLEYDAWFNLYLPGLARLGAPLPLGGTSNHLRRDVLEQCLGWDPYNVTEDADLGVRLARLGWCVGLLESTTYEEANSRVPSWLRQRSRWVKGYLQTVLVHSRQPRRLVREIGWKGTAVSALGMGGSVITQLLVPISWGLLVLWFVAEPAWLHAMFSGPVYFLALASLVFGNFALVYLALQVAVERGHDDLAPAALLMPVYWLLMSVATVLAFVDLIVRPHHWHKTEHGLHFAAEEVSAR